MKERLEAVMVGNSHSKTVRDKLAGLDVLNVVHKSHQIRMSCHEIRQDLTWQSASVRWQEPPNAGREHSVV